MLLSSMMNVIRVLLVSQLFMLVGFWIIESGKQPISAKNDILVLITAITPIYGTKTVAENCQMPSNAINMQDMQCKAIMDSLNC